MAKHFDIRITGRVQGVFFRENTRELAVKHNLSGFVRNEADGSVYIEVEGDEDNLKPFVEWLKQGPPMADVSNVEISDGKLENHRGFRVNS